MIMSLESKQLEQSIIVESEQLLGKIRLSSCPIWRFHYLGAISAYCELASKLRKQLSNSLYQQLIDVENQAIAEISQTNQCVRH